MGGLELLVPRWKQLPAGGLAWLQHLRQWGMALGQDAQLYLPDHCSCWDCCSWLQEQQQDCLFRGTAAAAAGAAKPLREEPGDAPLAGRLPAGLDWELLVDPRA